LSKSAVFVRSKTILQKSADKSWRKAKKS